MNTTPSCGRVVEAEDVASAKQSVVWKIICGICDAEHPDFKSAWGHWCDHLLAGDEMVDWVEVAKSMVRGKT